MIGRWALRSCRFGRKKFSRRNNSTEKTTEEKSAEVSKEAWPTLRKYSPLWVPILMSVVVTVDVINNAYHRKLVESAVPSYIQLVRKYIGFEDEDPKEIERIKETLAVQSEPLTALIELSSGAEVVEESADATLSYGDFYQQMALKHASEGSINKITFLDKRNQDDTTEDILTSDAKRHDIESSSGKKKVPYVIAPMLNSPLQRTLWDARSEESTRSSSSAVGNLTSDQSKVERRGSPVAQSLWSTAIFGAQKSEYNGIELNRTIMAQRCERIVSTVLADWKYFKSIENPNILLVKVNNSDFSGTESGKQDVAGVKGKSKTKDRMTQLMEVQEAKLAVESLEARITDLKTEKRFGTREIDQIENEITELRNEVTRLRRQYLNYFYYF